MNLKAIPALFGVLLFACPVLEAADDTPDRDQGLQAVFDQFPLFQRATNELGEPDFQTLTLNHPVKANGQDYYGFRFTVPQRENREDFVWSFLSPTTSYNWYIAPETGTMKGFAETGYRDRSKGDYIGARKLYPVSGRKLILQRLEGEALQDGKTYLIWFTFGKNKPARVSVVFNFAPRAQQGENEINAMEKSLGLLHAAGPPIVNPANGHIYMLLRQGTWKQSEARAVALGGHLATVRNQAEEDWILKTFGRYGGSQRLLWIGLSDVEKKFHFSWSSGESVSYTRWAPGEPNNAGRGEDFVAIYYPGHSQQGKWNDWDDQSSDPIGLPMNGVAEIIPKETKLIEPKSAAPGDPKTSSGSPAPTSSANPVSSEALAGKMAAIDIRPSLTITNDGGFIRLQWPIALADHMLEATTNLGQTFTMFGYSESTNLETGMVYATITNPVPRMFFRLRKP